MTDFLLGVGVGLVVGWNLLPQPKFVQYLYAQAVAKLTNSGK